MRRIEMSEWQTVFIEGHFIATESNAQSEIVTESRKLDLIELRNGLQITSNSFVGNVMIGDLQITIRPKIKGFQLLKLLRYAYSLRNLVITERTTHYLGTNSFLELLILQLIAEADELMQRGLRQEYVRTQESLPLPRGRFDFQRLARQGIVTKTEVPCIYYPRLKNTFINQILLSGLKISQRLTSDVGLRVALRQRIAALELEIDPTPLDVGVINRVKAESTRLTQSYEPAFAIIEILLHASAPTLSIGESSIDAPGFLFDMNIFFQTLLSKLFHDYLNEYRVKDEYQLRQMMDYIPEYNPRRRRAPTPRPDFVIIDPQTKSMEAILDAKYRDLWERSLPRDILYQLSIYALGGSEKRSATIIYPTTSLDATEQRIQIRDLLQMREHAQVILRPLNLVSLSNLLEDHAVNRFTLQEYISTLAFGNPKDRYP